MVNSGASGSARDTTRPAKRGHEDPSFGSNQQQAKRSRVSRACDQCRASRERCDGLQPVCHTCSAASRSCTYNEQPKKRGIQPNYIRTLELTIAWLFRTFPNAEGTLADALPDEDNDARALIGGKDPEVTETLHQSWRNSIVNKQIEQVLSGMTVDHRDPSDSVTNLTSPASHVEIGGHLDRTRSLPGHAKETRPSVQYYQLPGNAWALLEYYFAFIHTWLPMTEKHNLMKIMYSYPPQGLVFDEVNTAEHAELWSIMALISFQISCQSDSGAVRSAGRSSDIVPKASDRTSNEVDPERIGRLADSLLPPEGSSYEVPHIRALMLRALDEFQQDRVLAAWMRIGSVASLLHLFKLIQNLGRSARWCRHVHLAAFVIEGALAQRLKTVGHFRADYVRNVGLVDEDGLDEWTPWMDPLQSTESFSIIKAPAKAFSTLNDLARLYMRIYDEVTSTGETNGTGADLDGSIVSALLQNASSKQDRVQPSHIVAAFCHPGSRGPSTWSNAARPDLNQTWTVPETMDTGPGISTSSTVHSHDHHFMSIPVDSNTISSAQPQTGIEPSYPVPENIINPTLATEPPIEFDNASVDIFEELAALERQDSMHRPQFMQNLGFPDHDLAEFFGTDYQVSDPLLSYLRPDRIGSVSAMTDNG